MCGIFGWQFSKPMRRERLAVIAAVLQMKNDKRGGDSWGYYALDKGQTVKGIGRIALGVSAVRLAGHSAIMAHTRYATTGSVSPENSHPFHVGNVIGAHNGIVSNHEELNKSYNRQCKVDSEHIFQHINCTLPTDDISAYGAVEYVKTDNPGRIFLSRFNGGELAIAQLKTGAIWSSVAKDLKSALALAGLKAEFYRIDDGKLYYVQDGEAFTSGNLPFGAYRSALKWDEKKSDLGNLKHDDNSKIESGSRNDWYDIGVCPDCFEELTASGRCNVCGYYPFDLETEVTHEHAN